MKRVLLSSVVLAAGASCTDADLFVPPLLEEKVLDNKLELTGGFCAEGADELQAFLKVMLVVDRSNSMNVTDPNSQRISAAGDLVSRFIEDPVARTLQDGVEFAVLSFFGNVVTHTRNDRGLPGFSKDGPSILASLTQMQMTGSNTGYDKALAQAFLLLDADMAKLSDKARARSRYEVIFLSDGLPFPDNCAGEANSPAAAIAAVERIAALRTLHKVELSFHTAFASDPRMFTVGNFIDTCGGNFMVVPNTSIGNETRSLLQSMATEGGGSFTQFVNGDAISFEGFEFSDARRIFALSNFLVFNHSAKPNLDGMLPDSDRDGITDIDEEWIGTSPFLTDSDFDGFNDSVEWRFRLSGFDPLDPSDAQCSAVNSIDTDGDGLRDCEEAFMGTLRRAFDTDADGMPDGVETVFGTDANSANPLQDRQSDADADGGMNADEVRWHTDPRVVDVAERSKIAYNYFQSELPITTGQACYEFAVDNITLASTETPPPEQDPDGMKDPPGWNRVMLYFAQTPYDDPLAEPLYRVACVDARFVEDRDLKIPAGGQFEIPRRRPSHTFRASEVLRPNNDVCNASVNQDCGLNTRWCRFEDDDQCRCYRPPQTPMDPPDGTLIGPCPQCGNGLDDDMDGATDFPHDLDCFDSMDNDEGPNQACSNGADDDNDLLFDWPADPGCASAYDPDGSEADPTPLPECANGVDDDMDGAIDWPIDPGCFAANDPQEAQSLAMPVSACADGLDNDGDGLIDFGVGAGFDPGCFDAQDIDEDGPAICYFCEQFTDLLPGQCDLRTSYCRSRSGIPTRTVAGATSTTGCTTNADCRGSVCDPMTGACAGCIRDADCDTSLGAGDGLCNPSLGWCLTPSYTPIPCTDDTPCMGATCDTTLGYCEVDPYYACRTERDCADDHLCSEQRGFCQEPIFQTAPCDQDLACTSGTCDLLLGWCLPDQGSDQCRHNDECPFGDCLPDGFCDQQTFVFPQDFDPDLDCLRSR